MLLFLAVLQVLAPSAPPGGSVVGSVLDEASGTPIVGALVMAPDLQRVVLTDGEGRYQLDRLPPGDRELLVRFIGHEPRRLTAVVPADGTVRLDITLRRVPLPLAPLVTAASIPPDSGSSLTGASPQLPGGGGRELCNGAWSGELPL